MIRTIVLHQLGRRGSNHQEEEETGEEVEEETEVAEETEVEEETEVAKETEVAEVVEEEEHIVHKVAMELTGKWFITAEDEEHANSQLGQM